MHLILDDTHNSDIDVHHAKWNDSHQCLDKPDGQQHTLLCLEAADGVNAMVGGGSYLFVVTKSLPNNQNFTLINTEFDNSASKFEKKIDICIGGQFGDFSESIVVDKSAVQKAL